jgi:hypothetical protein
MERHVYAAIAIGLMVVLPLVSIVVELALRHGADILLLVGTWFTFWGIGVRLLIAGLNQVIRPGFTAQNIFKIDAPEALSIVSELGNANVAFGLIGILSLPFPGFLMPAAIAGGLFLALDAVVHLRRKERDVNENIALITDLVIPVTTILYLIRALGVL